MTQDLLFTTPHQIDKARVCIRRWAWDQIDKQPFEQGPEAAFGERAHKYREDYFRDGTPPDESTQEGRAAAHGLCHLPHPQPGLTPEVKAEADHDGVRLFMRVDLLETARVQNEKAFGVEYIDVARTIYDHKFVKDMHKGWHDKAEALNDPQVIAYCVWALKKYPVESVRLRWVYTTRPVQSKVTGKWGSIKSEARDIEVTRAEAFSAWDRVCSLPTQVMYQIRSKKVHPLTLPPNADACYMYGPKYACPRVAQCNLSDSDQMKGDQVNMEDLLANLRALAAGAAQAPAQPSAPPPAEPPAPAKSAEDLAQRLAGQAVGVNPPPRAEASPRGTNAAPPETSDAELGRAFRLVCAALRG